MKNTILFLSFIFISTACVPDKSKIQITMNKKSKSNLQQASISSVQIINNQLVINGNGFSDVTNVKVNGFSLNENFSIESKTATKIIANSIKAFSFDVSKIFSLILSDASASATFTIDFSLCNATLHGKGFNCAAPIADKDVLAYDAVSGTWKPRPASGLNYLGTFDASSNPGAGPTIQPAGAYYVISDDGTIAAVSFAVGDWLVSNGSIWQKIDNSSAVLSVHGRHGTVTAQSGDYTLDLLGDVSFPTAPAAGKVLKFDGTHWIAGDDLSGGGAGSVTTSAIAAGAVTDAKIDTVSASKITGTITSAQIADGTIVNADINAAAAIDYSKLNIPNAAIPYAKLNIANGDIPASKISGLPSDTAVLATSIVDGDLTHAPDGNSVFDALATKLDKTGGTITTMLNVPPPALDTEATTKLYVDTADNLRLNKTGGTITGVLDLDSDLRIKGGSNYVTIRGHATSAAYNLILPSTAGTSGYVLRTDGVGNLSWVAPGGGAFSGTASRAVATDGAGALTTVTTTAAELGFVNGVTSSIQTQLNTKQATGNYVTALTGDVTATGPGAVAATVAQVGGVTAANVAAGANLANAATNINTSNAIVKRDASGNFTAGTITANLIGTATNVTGTVAIANGGTGATTAVAARTNLGLGTAAVANTGSLINQLPLLGANATVGSMCTFDLTLGFICNTAIPSGNASTANPLSQFAATTSAQLAGVLSDETGTGPAVFNTAPTFVTNITTPMIIGGTTPTSTLTYKTTTGTGAAGADHIFRVGNNGATEAMRIFNSGNVAIGTSNSTAFKTLVQGTTATNILGITDGTATGAFYIENASASVAQVQFGSSTNHNVGLFTNNGPPEFTLTTAGNVGIGNPFPTAKLEVVGQVKITGGTPGAGKVLTSDAGGLASWTTIASGITTLTGDVTATGSGSVVATVAQVGGVTAANVAAGATLANAATTASTANTIVKRDGSGNFTATNVSGVIAVANGGTGKSTLGLNNLLFGNATSAVGEVTATATPSVLLSTNFTGLPAWTTSTTGNVLKGSVTGVAFGALAQSDLPAGSLSGSGTANYVPYYTAASTLAASPMIISGSNVGFGAASPTTAVDINGAQTMRGIGAPAVSPATQGRIYYDSATNKFKVSQNGGAYVDLVGAGGSSTIDGLTDGIANSGNGQLFLGTNAGAANSGLSNTAVGQNSMQLNTSGFQNSAFGNASLSKNLTGGTNAAFGMYSMKENTTGNDNTAFGEQTLNSNQTGSGNTALGRQSLYGFTGGSHSNNTGVGYRTGVNVTTGNNNIFLGYGAGDSLTSGSSNIVIGYDVEAPSNTGSNQMTIGNLIFGTGLTSTGTTVSSGKIGIGITAPAEKLSVAGVIQSTTGGFKFPDGSTQTAAHTTMLTDISAGISTACPMAYNFGINYSTATGWTCTLDLNGLSNATNGGSGLFATQLRWGYFYNYPTSFAIEDSADNSTWTTISASNNTGVQVLSAAVKRYVRFRSVDSDPFSNMAAVQVMGGPTSLTWAGNSPAFVLKETWRTSSGNVVIGPGRVGIGTTAPAAELHVVGDIQYTGIITDVSDRRLKKNLSPLERGLEMIRKIKTYSYIMKDDPKERTEYGVIAQDLQKINPNLVRIADEANGFLGVNYMGLVPFAINAIQDVDHEMKNLRVENEKLKLQLKNVEDLQKIQNKKIEKLLKKMGIKSEEM